MEKILVVRYETIGDSIFASAFLRELRRNKPNAQIDVLADKISYNIYSNCPYINNIILVKKKYRHLLYYVRHFHKYSTVYFLKSENFFTKVAFWSGVKNRIGFNLKQNKFLTASSEYKENKHEIDCYLDLLRISNIPVLNDNTELWIDGNAYKKTEKVLQNIRGKKVLIQAYSRFTQKNWIDGYWAEVIKYLINDCEANVFFAGAQKDIVLYDNLIKLLGNDLKKPPINMCAQLSIQETMALIKQMDMLIGVDSGLIHIAAALDIPSFLLHGPTSLARWKPRSDKCVVLSEKFACSPCFFQSESNEYCKGTTSRCMLALTPNMVIKKLDKYFQKAYPCQLLIK